MENPIGRRKVPDLVTARLVLREHVYEDWQPIERYAPQEAFWRFLQVGPLSKGSGREFIEKILKERKETPRRQYNLAVILKAQANLIGSIRIGIASNKRRQGVLGYGLDPAHWGRGYATEAVGRLLAFGFDELGLHRIRATCDTENTASRNVMQKLGMSREGLLRENELSGNQWRSSFLFSILEGEFRQRR